jgi:hypothetical protein
MCIHFAGPSGCTVYVYSFCRSQWLHRLCVFILPVPVAAPSKAPYTLSVKMSDFIVLRHTWRKNWINWAVLTGNSAGLRTVLSSRLSHTENCAVHTGNPTVFLSLLAHTTMASSQGTSVSSNPFSSWPSHDIFLFKYHFLLHILRFLFFFSDNIMADVTSKQQTTAFFLSTTATRTRRHTELTKNLRSLMGNLCCAREHSVQCFVQVFFTQLNCTFNLHCRSAAARLLRMWVRIPPGVWMSVCCECCVLSDRSLCVEPITRPEEPDRVWCVVVCDLETSWMRTPWSALGHSERRKN